MIPAGVLVTVPDPAPLIDTVSEPGGALELKVAVAEVAAVMVTVQVVAVPLHAPPQPPNEKPEAGVAVRMTWVFWVKLAVQDVAFVANFAIWLARSGRITPYPMRHPVIA